MSSNTCPQSPEIEVEPVQTDQTAVNASRQKLLELIRGPMPTARRVVAIERPRHAPDTAPSRMLTIHPSEAFTLVGHWITQAIEAKSSLCAHCGTLEIQIHAEVLDRIQEFLSAGYLRLDELRQMIDYNQGRPF